MLILLENRGFGSQNTIPPIWREKEKRTCARKGTDGSTKLSSKYYLSCTMPLHFFFFFFLKICFCFVSTKVAHCTLVSSNYKFHFHKIIIKKINFFFFKKSCELNEVHSNNFLYINILSLKFFFFLSNITNFYN